MKKLLCIFLLSVAGISQSHAQVPGYQGKRFAVGYNASSFFYLTELQFGEIIFGTRFSYKTEAYVNYTVSRKATIGFSYYFAKQNHRAEYAHLNGYSSIAENGVIPAKLSIYEFNLKVFRRNFIAPAGLYNQFGIAIVKYGLGTDDNKLALESTDGYMTYRDTLDGPKDMFTCVKLSYHIGRIVPVGNNLLINMAFGVNFFQGMDAPRINGIDERTYIQSTLNRGLRTHNSLEIKIGVGWLAF